jgi:protein-S-isoprenylcysteine O-methyltransferase Ste14
LGLLAVLSPDADPDAARTPAEPLRGPPPRLIDVALGLSVLSWAVLGFLRADPASRLSLARLTITALNASVGVLFIARRDALRRAPLRSLLLALPSIVMSGAALKLAPPLSQWPLGPSILFTLGGLLAIASLATLGRCFALLPAVRGVVTTGPFRIVRHPAYAGELVMLAACALTSPRPLLAWPALLLAASLFAVRIVTEERLLIETPAYRDYTQRVRFRLLPFIW